MTVLFPMLRFVAVVTAVSAGLLVAGLLLTRSSPAATREAILWSSGVAFVGSIVGFVPMILGSALPTGPETPSQTAPGAGPAAVSRFLASMILRMGAVVVGSVAVILLGEVPAKPFLLWLGVCYLALLTVETAFALKIFRSL